MGPQNRPPNRNRPRTKQEAVQEDVPTVEIPKDKQQLIGLKSTTVAIRPLQKLSGP